MADWDVVSQIPVDTYNASVQASVPTNRLSREEMRKRWLAKGYSEGGADGMAGNMVTESSGKSTAVNPDSKAFGLFQYLGSRKAELKEYADANGKSVDDPDVQIDFADMEMKRDYPALRKQLMSSDIKSADAYNAFRRVFERPGPEGGTSTGSIAFSPFAVSEYQGKKGTDLVHMSPADYLALSPTLENPWQDASGKALRASLDRGDAIEKVPTLTIKPSGDGSAEVTDQDGRHRALAAQEAGAEAIPVAVQGAGKGQPLTEIQGMTGKVLPYDFKPVAPAPQGTIPPAQSANLPTSATLPPISANPPPQKQGLAADLRDFIMPKAAAAEFPPKADANQAQAQFVAGSQVSAQPPPPAPSGDPWAVVEQKPIEGGEWDVAEDKPPMSRMQSFGTGLVDTLVGAGQAVANLPSSPLDWIPGLKPRTIDDTAGINNAVRQREETIQAQSRDPGSTDWFRVAGNVANPLNYLGPSAMMRGAGMAGRMGLGAAQGAIAAGMQPVTGANFGREKAEQVGIGAAAGALAAPAVEALTRALSPVVDPIVRYAKGIAGPKAVESAAVKEVLRKIVQDAKGGGPTAQDMLDLVNATPNKPLTLADVGGENVLALAGKIARSPGEGRQIVAKFLNDRDLGAGTRLVEDVNRNIGRGSSYDAAHALAEARRNAAAPLYERAFAETVTMPQVRPLQRFITDRIGQDALAKGMRVIELEHLAEGRLFNPERYGVTAGQDHRFIIDPDILRGGKAPSVRMLDAVKRGYDDIVESFRDKTSGRLDLDQYGRAVNSVRANYTGMLRQALPRYADALNAWSGPSQTLDALRAGQNFLRQRPEEVARRIQSLTPGDAEFYKLGAADTLRKALAQKGPEADEAKALLRNQWTRDLLRPLFNSQQEFDHFANSVAAEGRMFGTRFNVLKGSQTAARLAEDQSPEAEAFAHAARGAVNAAHGNWLGAGHNILRSMLTLGRAPDPELQAEIGRVLMQPLSQASSAPSGMELLQNFSQYAPQTRNYLRQYSAPAGQLAAPAASLYGTSQR